MAAKKVCIPMNGQYGFQQVYFHLSEDSVLGRGSYGSVVKAKLDDLPCAAKILHQNIFNTNDPRARDFIARFEQECNILRGVKHPHIVQFLGVVQDPNTRQLILLMEKLKESLTIFLKHSTEQLPYHIQVNVSHDISLAIAHLHRNKILHRDLSSNNVLLNAACQAKVTDFGMAKIADSNPLITRSEVTQCLGTQVYMPPEALLTQPQYTEKLDTFSIGVLIVQTITCRFPSPTDAQIIREDLTSPTGVVITHVSELERRRADMRDIPATHPLLPLAQRCLKDWYQQRPDATELCQSLASLKTTPAYNSSTTVYPILPTVSHPHTTPGQEKKQVIIGQQVDDIPAEKEVLNGATLSSTPMSGSLMEVEQITDRLQDLPQNIAGDLDPSQKAGGTELHEAAERGDVQAVQRLINTVDSNSRTEEDGDTALHLAARKGHVEVVRVLINAHALLNLRDEEGQTPLFWASLKGHVAVVQLLIQSNADVNVCNEDGVSPVYVAYKNGHTHVVEILLNGGANANLATTESGDVPLVMAAQKGHTQTVQRLLEARANVNHQKKDGTTALYWATMRGHVTIVRLLIQGKADVNIFNKDGFCPLYVASMNGLTDVVDLLIKAGADIHLATPQVGDVPLGVAAEGGHTQTVQRLLEARANVNQENKGSVAPLQLASLNGHVAVVRLLIQNRADVNNCDENGFSPLYAASQNGHTDIVDLLIKAGADIHIATTKEGDVPLEAAAGNGHTQIVKRLLEAKANVNHQNKFGVTALFYAGWHGHLEVVKTLLQAGARDMPNKFGDTALTKAKANNHSEVVRLLKRHK